MKTILLTFTAGLTLFALTSFAQTPASKPAAKSAGATRRPAAAAGPNRALLNPAALKAKAPDVYKATFTTTKGDFVVEVHRDWAPNGADRFYNLVKNGYFNGAAFFRVISGFMAQFGITPSPAVNKAWMNANIQDDPVKQSNKRGYVTFAMSSAPNSRSSQIFINYADNARLDPSGFAPFGNVIEGMEVVDKLYSGYGEGAPGGAGPEQGRLQAEGKAYLDKEFPLLDKIVTAKITSPAAPAGPVRRPAGPPVKKIMPVKPAAK